MVAYRNVAETADSLDAVVGDLSHYLTVGQGHGEHKWPCEYLDLPAGRSLSRQTVEAHKDVWIMHLVNRTIAQKQYVAQQACPVEAGEYPSISNLSHAHHAMHR